ncbi:MAG: hypothetical protein GY756_07580 [bacterium]|nr:hypothetical protein [bacterium]
MNMMDNKNIEDNNEIVEFKEEKIKSNDLVLKYKDYILWGGIALVTVIAITFMISTIINE